ncbi:MAG TPA: hypothetical protein VM681_01360 [Candidatus Thermoplasmatota archaeon]|nr:hypothetical protein [Candidatus Thermoplasmatota archaeon]
MGRAVLAVLCLTLAALLMPPGSALSTERTCVPDPAVRLACAFVALDLRRVSASACSGALAPGEACYSIAWSGGGESLALGGWARVTARQIYKGNLYDPGQSPLLECEWAGAAAGSCSVSSGAHIYLRLEAGKPCFKVTALAASPVGSATATLVKTCP